MRPTMPLFYAAIGGVTGITFQLAESVIFAPCDDETLRIVHDTKALTVTSQVPDLFASFLRETIIEARLENLGGVR
jgi:hypothetical protein